MAGSMTRNIPAVLAILSVCFALGASNPKPQARSSSPCAEGASYYPDPSDCNAYYQCVSEEESVQLHCPPGLHWNNAASECDWPENAGCVLEDHDEEDENAGDAEDGNADEGDDEEGDNEEGKEEEEEEEGSEEEEGDEEDSGDSSVSSGDSSTSEESVEGSDSSSESGSEEIDCKDDDDHPECPKEGSEFKQFIPHPDPTKFYHCSNGIAYCKECPANLIWNHDIKTCDWPDRSE